MAAVVAGSFAAVARAVGEGGVHLRGVGSVGHVRGGRGAERDEPVAGVLVLRFGGFAGGDAG